MSSPTLPSELLSEKRYAELQATGEFVRRHNGPGPDEISAMLETLGYENLDSLTDQAIPAGIRSRQPLNLPGPRTEPEVIEYLRKLAASNSQYKSWIGMGYSNCFTPPVILRNILENPGWYTSYTPYQAEISQGRLEALLNFQTMIMELTGMEIANASLLDEATAAAEAMTMCHGIKAHEGKHTFWIAEDCHPQTISVVKTRAYPLGIEVRVGDPRKLQTQGDEFAFLVQYPNTYGAVRDNRSLAQAAHEAGGMVIFAADLLGLALLTPPGELGADVVVGSSQRFGVPFGFGGPHAAYFATRDSFKRQIPGRMVGVSMDSHGHPAIRLALQTREQHIRREKATSNICTAQVLLAVMAGMYGVYHGPQGVAKIARRVHRTTAVLAEGLRRLGIKPASEEFFDTVTFEVAEAADKVLIRAQIAGVNLRKIDDRTIGIALDETTTPADVEQLWKIVSDRGPEFRFDDLADSAPEGIPASLRRSSPYLTHPVFNIYHSETEMLRYLYRLQEKDLSLTKSMIPLGSCTMKLNATAEMIPVTFPGFAGIHPFAPLEQVPGYMTLIRELEQFLVEITGFHSVSLQPNAGSQGEYAGLLLIRHYHESRGQGHRDICLIPSSAHGTNPASAAMAGLKVVVVPCDDHGNIDIPALRQKAEEHRDRLSSLMITYPSTHGVFEEGIREICRIIHDNGGQVYMDGANLNALVGLCRPGEFGPDVAHLNLHKTFCIPHGGGGPGVGPIGVGEHLAPFLPGHPVVPQAGPSAGIGPVSAAPWGSAGILPIPWAYIALMGPEGLKQATQVAILNANYVARRLTGHYPILYTGKNGLVAHECIIDCRPLKAAGVEVEDVAKRLMDYGFHAPTMSWPVPGTLMIEPTESESQGELDRFCDALIAIRAEARAIEEGKIDPHDNPLKNAPHTIGSLVDEWTHPYTREQAVFPLPWVKERKFWPPVGRIDNVYGDRNLVCACPPIEAYAE